MSKVWFVTGAGSGIGAGIVKAALKADDCVATTGRSLDEVRNAFGGVNEEKLAVVQLDVTAETQAKMAIEQALHPFGGIDVLVNNAGYSLLGHFEELGIPDMERLFTTNFCSVAYVMRAVLPVMRKQRSGRSGIPSFSMHPFCEHVSWFSKSASMMSWLRRDDGSQDGVGRRGLRVSGRAA